MMIEKEKKILERVTDVYIFIIIVLFPLIINRTGYFHILECKWKSYFFISILYFIIIISILIFFRIKKKVCYIKKIQFNKIHYFALLFLLINILSCLFSPYFSKYNLLLGEGRGEGLIMISIYLISFLFISLFGVLKKHHLLYFSFSSILISSIGILQYLGFNPFFLYKRGLGFYNCLYITTIGNVDTISAIYCIFLSISSSAYLFLDNKKYENIIHILSLYLGFFLFGIINVQSGKVAFIMILILLLPIIISNNNYLKKFFKLLIIFLFSYCSHVMIHSQYSYHLNQFRIEPQLNGIVFVFLGAIFILFLFSRYIGKLNYNFSDNKKLMKRIYLFILCLFGLFIFIIFVFDIKYGILHEMHELLHGNFDDKFGSYRIFLWKRTLKLIPEYPLLGSGSDSFALRFMAKYTKDVSMIGPLTINDTAANVYLTTAINTGIIGLIIYICLLIFHLSHILKSEHIFNKVLGVAIFCYIIQDFFNFSVVIVSPIFWLVLGLNIAKCQNFNDDS